MRLLSDIHLIDLEITGLKARLSKTVELMCFVDPLVPSIIIGDDHKISRIVMNYLGTLSYVICYFFFQYFNPRLRCISLDFSIFNAYFIAVVHVFNEIFSGFAVMCR